jgi:hypothetical protein
MTTKRIKKVPLPSVALKVDAAMSVMADTYQEGGDHYQTMPIEPWSIIDTWPMEQQVGYHRGNVLKYTMRMGNKLGEERTEAAEKASHYSKKLVEVLAVMKLAEQEI